jgi:hypothetical protein
MRRRLLVVVAILVVLSVFALPAFAEDGEHMPPCDSGQAFGQHVPQMAQTHGFDGTHNPGVHHQGFSICVVSTP